MYILLTPEMKTIIRATDEFYCYNSVWEYVPTRVGTVYTDNYYPARRKITSLADLGEVLLVMCDEKPNQER